MGLIVIASWLYLLASQPKTWLLPAPLRYVADYAGVIDDQTEEQLNDLLQSLQLRTDVPFVVLTVEHTSGVQLPWYAARTAMAWGLRTKDKDRGVLLVYVQQDQALRLEHGNELRSAIQPGLTTELEDRFRSYIRSEGASRAIYLCAQLVAGAIARSYDVSLTTPTGLGQPNIGLKVKAPAWSLLCYLATAWLILGAIWLLRRLVLRLSGKAQRKDHATGCGAGSAFDPFGGGEGPFGTSQARPMEKIGQRR